MPFDGLDLHGCKSPDHGRLVTACRRAADTLAVMWPQGPFARRFGNNAFREDLEPATVPGLLYAARSLIASEERWTKGRLRTRDGKLCAMGAILRVSARGSERRLRRPATAYLLSVARQRGFTGVEQMNDASTHVEVLTAFDEAIHLSTAPHS